MNVFELLSAKYNRVLERIKEEKEKTWSENIFDIPKVSVSSEVKDEHNIILTVQHTPHDTTAYNGTPCLGYKWTYLHFEYGELVDTARDEISKELEETIVNIFKEKEYEILNQHEFSKKKRRIIETLTSEKQLILLELKEEFSNRLFGDVEICFRDLFTIGYKLPNKKEFVTVQLYNDNNGILMVDIGYSMGRIPYELITALHQYYKMIKAF